MKDFESELKKIFSSSLPGNIEAVFGYCGHKENSDKLDTYLFSVVDDLNGEEDFPEEILQCHYCLDRLLKIQKSVLAAENKSIRPLKKVLFDLKKNEWVQKLRIQVRILKDSLELLACPGFNQPLLVPAPMLRVSGSEFSYILLNREFSDFHLEIQLSLEDNKTTSIYFKLTEQNDTRKLPNRFRFLKEECLLESLELVDSELCLDHLDQGIYGFEFLRGEENLGSFSLDLK